MNYEIFVERDLEPVIPLFQENRLKDLVELKEALAKGDRDRLQFMGHSLKGVGSGYGFVEVTNIGREIESLAKANALSEIGPMLVSLEDYLNNVTIVYVDED